MLSLTPHSIRTAWRLQDAKAQFSELVDNAMRGVPQHVTRRGKQAVVVLSEQDFEMLTRGAEHRADRPTSFIGHLLAMPKASVDQDDLLEPAFGGAGEASSLDLLPREIDFS